MKSYSLLTKYAVIIILSLIVVPGTYFILNFVYLFPVALSEGLLDEPYKGKSFYEEAVHKEARQLGNQPDKVIHERLSVFHKQYPEARIFWVDENGETQNSIPKDMDIPKAWTPAYTVEFMKESYDSDPFTVVAFIGTEQKEGFLVFQINQELLEYPMFQIDDKYRNLYEVLVLAIIGVFFLLSLWFFLKIRKRLTALSKVMQIKEGKIPNYVDSPANDEIGELEKAFNEMVNELEKAQEREAEEERIRRELMTNLSHDIRTPLTTIRAHGYNLKDENLTKDGQQSLNIMNDKISFVSSLIENLFSYNLLQSGKYRYQPKDVDIIKLLRTVIIQWYPVFENEGFDIRVHFPEQSVIWYIDSNWLERIMDNLFQNVKRHAHSGKFFSISVESTQAESMIIISDKGPGFRENCMTTEYGIGLGVVDAMVKEMELAWEIDTSDQGTTIKIIQSSH
ncbi:HAMP domain-containing sensor histidine kinase [Priestia sp. GS2]|uniref:HAMP domain-containing sensor histidine kinase n=1 Tax=Priestia sp. GS2 TaxID=3117403 RepID=UPI002EDAF917